MVPILTPKGGQGQEKEGFLASAPSGAVGRSGRWLVRYPRAVPLAIFVLIAAITALSVFAIERSDNRREQAQIAQSARDIGAAVDRRGNTTSAYLRAGAALFETVDAVPYELFERFASEMRLDENFRGVDGVGWAESIYAFELTAFEDRVREQTGKLVRVNPRPDFGFGDRLIPVTYLLPDTERAGRALGFDMYSEAVRREAMDIAAKTGRPKASGPIVLVQEGEGEAPGFLIYMPVYFQEDTGRRLKGYVYSPVNARSFLEASINSGIVGERSVRLYDGAAAAENLLAAHQPENGIGRSATAEIIIADRVMTIEVQSAKGATLTPVSMLTLLFGLAVASLSMLIARLLTQQAYEDLAALEYYEEQNSIRNSLTRELNHRVKNTLANVLSIIALTRRRADNLEDFATGLDGRIRALSATHDLLTQSEWGTTPLRQVIEAELAPYADPEGKVLDMSGPDVELAPNDALSFGLAIHELATNAAKYGALSADGGKVKIRWDYCDRNDVIEVRWCEQGGPPVGSQRKRGFGTELIEKIVAHELRQPVDLDFAEQGVRCTLRVPVRKRGEFAIRAKNDEAD